MSRWQRQTSGRGEYRRSGSQLRLTTPKKAATASWYQNRLLLSVILSIALIVMAVGILFITGAWYPLVSQIAGPQTSSGLRVAWSINAQGRVLLVQRGALSLVTLPDRKERELVGAQSRSVVTSARWQPDGKVAAYSYVNWRPGEREPRADILLTDLSGEPRPLIQSSAPGELLESPAWAPDGSALYVSTTVTENRVPVQRLERIDLESGARTRLGEGSSPDVSPDGTLIAAVRFVDINPTLVLLQPDGNVVRTLINPGRYTLIGSPRFSPDGQQLAVTLAAPPGQAREPSPSTPFGLLDVPTAHAHGNPSELYLLDVAGGEPKKLTSFAEDEPAVTWSPDGSSMAVYATQGLYLIDRAGKVTLATNTGGYGAIDWAP